jgi:hypothetical protein
LRLSSLYPPFPPALFCRLNDFNKLFYFLILLPSQIHCSAYLIKFLLQVFELLNLNF